jgi:hypothetical protein
MRYAPHDPRLADLPGRIKWLAHLVDDAEMVAGAIEFHLRAEHDSETAAFLKRLHTVTRDFVVVTRLELARFTLAYETPGHLGG